MKLNVPIRPTAYGEPETVATLSDEHSASSYGQPVLILADNSVLGPGEYAYTFAGDHPLIEKWNALVLPIIDQLCQKQSAAPRPVDTTWLDDEVR